MNKLKKFVPMLIVAVVMVFVANGFVSGVGGGDITIQNVETLNLTVAGGDEGFGGTSNFDTIALSEDLTITDALTVSGETSVKGFTQGGGTLEYATSTGTTVLTEAQLLAYNAFELMVNTGSTATFTLPATSTMTTLIPNSGDMRSFVIHNATSSTMALTIAAGAGIDLVGVTTNDDVIDETEYTELTCIRQVDTDVTCIVSELLHVD